MENKYVWKVIEYDNENVYDKTTIGSFPTKQKAIDFIITQLECNYKNNCAYNKREGIYGISLFYDCDIEELPPGAELWEAVKTYAQKMLDTGVDIDGLSWCNYKILKKKI